MTMSPYVFEYRRPPLFVTDFSNNASINIS